MVSSHSIQPLGNWNTGTCYGHTHYSEDLLSVGCSTCTVPVDSVDNWSPLEVKGVQDKYTWSVVDTTT